MNSSELEFFNPYYSRFGLRNGVIPSDIFYPSNEMKGCFLVLHIFNCIVPKKFDINFILVSIYLTFPPLIIQTAGIRCSSKAIQNPSFCLLGFPSI